LAKLAANTPYAYIYNYLYPFDSYYKRSIALGGYSFDINNHLSFTVSVNLLNDISNTIYFSIQDDLVVYYMVFHIVLSDITSDWFFVQDFGK
jgi:hypothetical protein